MAALIPNVINASGNYVDCLPSHFFKHYQNPRGDKFEAYCCDNYDTVPSWTDDYEADSAAHPEFPEKWVYSKNSCYGRVGGRIRNCIRYSR
jgi:hypothetical protein